MCTGTLGYSCADDFVVEGMKAAILHEFRTPLVIEEIPRPEPAKDEVLIQVEACGVCHSDLHVASGDWKQFAGIVKKPLTLGHEVVGRVAEKGSAVAELQVGAVGLASLAARATRTFVRGRRSLG